MTPAARASLGQKRAAVFLDRDGTLIQAVPDLRRPEDVVLVPHAANALRYITYALIPLVVVTNTGAANDAEYASVKARLDDQLAECNANLEATYACPHAPDAGCACRKPRTALFEQAIEELSLDASRCAYIGDRLEDLIPARTLGGRGILVPSPSTPGVEIVHAAREFEIAATLTDAVHLLLGPEPASAAGET